MLIIADYRYPNELLNKLSEMGGLILFNATGLVYESISGHPDIFLCETPNGLLAAPNTPEKILKALERHQISYRLGTNPAGNAFPTTVRYNALVTSANIIHNEKYTEKIIPEMNTSLNKVNVSQAYTRCSLFNLDETTFITSDRGIEMSLKEHFEIHYFSPENILLSGQKHGFLGGCIGRHQQTIFFTGRMDTLPQSTKLKKLLDDKSLKYVELYDGPLIDGGGLFFLKS